MYVFVFKFWVLKHIEWASQLVLLVKNLPVNAGDTGDGGLILGLGRSLELSTLRGGVRSADGQQERCILSV